MAIRNQLLVFLGGGVVFGGLTFWWTLHSGDAERTQESREQQYQSVVQSGEVSHTDSAQNARAIASTAPMKEDPNATTASASKEPSMLAGEASLVESLEDGRMLIDSDQFSQLVNAQDFALVADEFVYRHPVNKSQQAYETEADIERLLLADEYVHEQGFEVDYFKCSNDYCVLAVDTSSEENADKFFAHFVNSERDYANFVQGGGSFSIIPSNQGASARLAFGISDGFRSN